MNIIRSFFVTLCTVLLGGFEAVSQNEAKVQVDPGVSVHNYKHTHKAKKAESMQQVQTKRRFSSRVGIVPRSINAPRESARLSTPKYKRRSVWSFFKNSNPTPTRLNPLTNPGNYKTQ
ncbi:hypothetical protein [Persicitalea jodogahamensis]|uniref:Uncharacterized protein n=1 Tax=Persicitalea jodogahamensis TaxID=402147 RepID=A0A8J3G9J8_9BACT|nr:hypothetical protein [Persicitalea jodogahamensis]GHB67385.1 hypothetical protein GCM10007390_20870 [Persicitalea jodogahamensis]